MRRVICLLMSINGVVLLPHKTALASTHRVKTINHHRNPQRSGARKMQFTLGGQTLGKASWYGPRFIHRKTASGEYYTGHELTAAFPNVPFGTHLLVMRVSTRQSVIVRVNDRGAMARYHRLIDLSPAAAAKLDMMKNGLTPVKVTVLDEPSINLSHPTLPP